VFSMMGHLSGFKYAMKRTLAPGKLGNRFPMSLGMVGPKPPNNDMDAYNFGDDDDEDEEDENKAKDRDVPNPGSNAWDENVVGNFQEESLPSMDPLLAAQLEEVLEETVTEMAIKTAKYYMEEFRDDVALQYVSNFNNFSEAGFGADGWREYLEGMIRTDKHDIIVTMVPPTALKKAHHGKNIRVQYTVKIEPRKIAHQLVTIREQVCNELIEDLKAIRNENNEAARFADLWTRASRAEAEKSRRPSRVNAEGTPHRDRNYYDIDLLVTNCAIDMFKTDILHVHGNPKDHQAMVEYLDKMLSQLSEDFESKDMLFKVLNKDRSPQTLLETLYHDGLEQPVAGEGQTSINRLKLAQEFFKLRLIVAREASRLLASIVLNSRSYYKLIKDCGGFARIDLSGRPKYVIVDLDEELAKEKKIAEERAAEDQLQQMLKKIVQKQTEQVNAAAAAKEEVAEVDANISVEDVDLFDRDPDAFFWWRPHDDVKARNGWDRKSNTTNSCT